MGKKYLKQPYKDLWSADNPTLGYCYVVSEFLYHEFPGKYIPYVMKIENGTHWFLKDVEGNIVDYTVEQFNNKLNYSLARQAAF